MKFTRRDVMAIGAGAAAVGVLGPMQASAATADELIAGATGGAEVGTGNMTLTAPEIAENGNTVPIGVDAPGATQIVMFAPGNPAPPIATLKFGPLSPTQSASTRIRLAKSQDIVAVAQMADGSWIKASAAVKVTIGGCGG